MISDHINTNTKRGVALDISSLCQTCKLQMQIPTCKQFFWLKSKVYVASLNYFALLLLSCFKVHLHMHMGLCSISTIRLLHMSWCVLHRQWKRVSQLIWNSVPQIGSELENLTDSSLSIEIHRAFFCVKKRRSKVEAELQFLVNWSERQK